MDNVKSGDGAETCPHLHKEEFNTDLGCKALCCLDCHTIEFDIQLHTHEWMPATELHRDPDSGKEFRFWFCKHCPKMTGCYPGIDPNEQTGDDIKGELLGTNLTI